MILLCVIEMKYRSIKMQKNHLPFADIHTLDSSGLDLTTLCLYSFNRGKKRSSWAYTRICVSRIIIYLTNRIYYISLSCILTQIIHMMSGLVEVSWVEVPWY